MTVDFEALDLVRTQNKAEQYERQKLTYLEDRIKTLEKSVANLTERYAEIRTWQEENFRGEQS
jgi:predicted  nucleic acid-binding Zn-ribbon protein